MPKVVALAALTLVALGAALHPRTPSVTAGTLPVWFVNANIAVAGDGTAWDKALKSLTTALGKPGDKEIWVAGGTYVPPVSFKPSIDKRTATFTVGPGDRVFGGFTGAETSLEQRDPAAHETILSGNIQNPGSGIDNAYTVVTLPATADATAILDGFTVTTGFEDRDGQAAGGIESQGGSPVLANLVVRDNFGQKGAGLYSAGGGPSISQSRFVNNIDEFSRQDMSGLASGGGSLAVADTTFLDTRTGDLGGYLVKLFGGSASIARSTFEASSGVGV